MKKTRFLLPTLLLLLLLGSTAKPAAACSCMVGTPADYAGYADVIFVGEVTDVQVDSSLLSFSNADPVLVRFAVSETWVQDVPAGLTLETARDEAMCGYNFAVGSTYLVYASYRDGQLATDICSGTKLERDATADRAYLGESVAPSPAEVDTGAPAQSPRAVVVMLIVGAGFLALAGTGTLMVRLLRS